MPPTMLVPLDNHSLTLTDDSGPSRSSFVVPFNNNFLTLTDDSVHMSSVPMDLSGPPITPAPFDNRSLTLTEDTCAQE